MAIAAASQVIKDVNQVPGKEVVATFLKGYLAGRSVAEIAQELGVSREWCSRNYRWEALRLARKSLRKVDICGALGLFYVQSLGFLTDEYPLNFPYRLL